ncbi:nuclear transport factor 2 family protein [Saccharopolyspora sp. ASAGF58]|uniref:nuclear transport factor 2 family protein n=1 Tax=Saccharopolyspora sp. ASAGF58 TaxID=2719023 RepID=UPI001FF0D41B|nr:nuclear transport factor 2 family protein [Saccharopolyspora sp. ASAGF58]
MTATNATKSVLEGMYAAEAEYMAADGPGEASFAPLAEFFSPDVVLHQAEAMPYGGTWHGHQGMERFFLAMSRTWESFEMLEQDFLASDNTTGTAVVLTHVRARARETGRDLEFAILQTIAIRNEQITEIHPFYWDTAAIADICANPAPTQHQSH